MNLLKDDPHATLAAIQSLPVGRIREHFRRSAWFHWAGKPEGQAIIAAGADMQESLTRFCSASEFETWGRSIGWPESQLQNCCACIRTAERNAGNINNDPDLRFYTPEAAARIKYRRTLEAQAGRERAKRAGGGM